MSPRFASLVVAAAVATTALVPAPAHANEAAAMGALKLAKHYYDKGDFKKAAERFREAYGIHPNPAFLFNAARAEQRGFMLDDAERDFKEVLKKSKDKTMRHRAEVHLQEIAAYRKQLAAQGTDAAKAKAAADKAKRDAEKAKREAAAARKEAAQAKEEAAVAKKAVHGKGAQKVVAGMAGLSLKEKVLYGASAGLLVISAITYGVALSARGQAVDLEPRINDAENPLVREELIEQHQKKVEDSGAARGLSVITLGLGVGLGWYNYAYGAPSKDEPAKATSGWRLDPWVDGRGLALSGRF